MKKDFVISRIEASQDGAPYVYIALNDPNDFKPGSERQQNPFGPNMMAFTSPEDLMKNLPKAMANISKAMGCGNVNITGLQYYHLFKWSTIVWELKSEAFVQRQKHSLRIC